MFTLASASLATGAQTLVITFSPDTTATNCYVSAVAFNNTDTTTGINTGHTTTNSGAVYSVTVTSDANGATVGAWAMDGGTGTPQDQTAIWDYAVDAPSAGGSYAIGGTSNTHTAPTAGTQNYFGGIHVISA
jgi:hypothetical protein